jgi:hypothetical protein
VAFGDGALPPIVAVELGETSFLIDSLLTRLFAA